MELSNTIYSNYEMFQYYVDIINNKIKELNLKIDIKIASIFGKVVGLEEYEITSNITGYKENDKLKFKNE